MLKFVQKMRKSGHFLICKMVTTVLHSIIFFTFCRRGVKTHSQYAEQVLRLYFFLKRLHQQETIRDQRS